MPNKILVLFAHPAIHRSVINRRLIHIYDEFSNVTFHDLYDTYPEFMIDIEREQALLVDHDIVIFHHPMYWYSCPPILKQWMDLVLKSGFAYGENGYALKGKKLLSTISTGQGESAFSKQGVHRNTIRDFLLPFEQMAHFCHMTYLPPFVAYCGANRFNWEIIIRHINEYRSVIFALSESTFDFKKTEGLDRLQSDLSIFESYQPEKSDAHG